MMVCRSELEQVKAENAQLLVQLSQDKLDIADLNKWYFGSNVTAHIIFIVVCAGNQSF